MYMYMCNTNKEFRCSDLLMKQNVQLLKVVYTYMYMAPPNHFLALFFQLLRVRQLSRNVTYNLSNTSCG